MSLEQVTVYIENKHTKIKTHESFKMNCFLLRWGKMNAHRWAGSFSPQFSILSTLSLSLSLMRGNGLNESVSLSLSLSLHIPALPGHSRKVKVLLLCLIGYYTCLCPFCQPVMQHICYVMQHICHVMQHICPVSQANYFSFFSIRSCKTKIDISPCLFHHVQYFYQFRCVK